MVKEKKEKEATSTSSQATITDTATNNATDNNSSTSTAISATSVTHSTSTTSMSISANQSAYMLNLYNAFFTQYMQNYAQQKLPQTASTSSTTVATNDVVEYDSLSQQAAFYAQQQQSIQKQLETCLTSATQQYLKDLIP